MIKMKKLQIVILQKQNGGLCIASPSRVWLSSCVCSGVRKNIPMAQSATIKIMNATTFDNLDMVYPWNNLGSSRKRGEL